MSHTQAPFHVSKSCTYDEVGYDTVGLRNEGEAKAVGNTFFKIDKSGLTFKDIEIAGLEGSEGEGVTVYFQVLDGSGRAVDNMTYFWYDYDYSEGEPYSGVEIDEWCHGWYDRECSTSYNNLPLPAGEGVWMYSPNTKFKVQCAGMVPDAPVSVFLRSEGEAKMVVNPMPVNLTFGDMWIAGLEGSEGEGVTVYFQVLDGSGRAVNNMTYFWYDYDYSEGEPYSGIEIDEWCYGWYDRECSTSYNNLPLPMGEGVWMYSPNTKYSVNFKSPIQKEVE